MATLQSIFVCFIFVSISSHHASLEQTNTTFVMAGKLCSLATQKQSSNKPRTAAGVVKEL